MRIERLREGIIAFNKLNGKIYMVTDAENGTGHAVELDASGLPAEDGSAVDITEKNALAFRIIKDDKPYPVPTGYYAEDGRLMKGGEPACDMGEIEALRIVAEQPDCLILTAKNGKGGMAKLMSYQVSRDRFAAVCGEVPEDIKLIAKSADGTVSLFAYSKTDEKEAKDEDGNTKAVRVLGMAGLIAVSKGSTVFHNRYDVPITVGDIVAEECPERPGYFLALIPSDEDKDEDGCLVPAKKRTWLGDGFDSFEFEADGKASMDWSPMYHGFVIRTDGMAYVPGLGVKIESPLVKELEGYGTLIDFTKEDYAYRLTFSNDAYEFKTLVSKSTKDRGYIVTVE